LVEQQVGSPENASMARTWLKTTLSRLVKESAIAAIQVCLTLYFLFVSLVGGLLLFGWSGLVLGPVILTVTSALLEICGNRLGKPEEGVQSTARAGLTSLTPAPAEQTWVSGVAACQDSRARS